MRTALPQGAPFGRTPKRTLCQRPGAVNDSTATYLRVRQDIGDRHDVDESIAAPCAGQLALVVGFAAGASTCHKAVQS